MNTVKKIEKMNFKCLDKKKLIKYFEAFEDKIFVNFTIRNTYNNSITYREEQEKGNVIKTFINNIQKTLNNIRKFADLCVETRHANTFKGREYNKNLLMSFDFWEDLDFLKIGLYIKVERGEDERFFVEKEIVINNKKIDTKNLDSPEGIQKSKLNTLYEELIIVLGFAEELKKKYED